MAISDSEDGRNSSYFYNVSGTADFGEASLGLGWLKLSPSYTHVLALPESKVRVPSEMVAIGEIWAFGSGLYTREYSPYPSVIGPDFLAFRLFNSMPRFTF